ncbi:MAG: hypothetical protein IT353_16920 [Gemmatimonadaceae bacterium]|nr:hypothetical protein [Gemmatimonadaceae bacterium]
MPRSRSGASPSVPTRARRAVMALAGLSCVALASGSCVPAWTPHVAAPSATSLTPDITGPLRVHLRSGEMIIASAWAEDTAARTLRVDGIAYSAQRAVVGVAQRAIPIDSVALVQSYTSGTAYAFGLTMLAVWGTATTFVAGSCLADPKSCFGSCPTFYLPGDTTFIHAEGFSASPLKMLEATDVDHLYFAPARTSSIDIVMRNEALETHAVRSLRVLAVPRPVGAKVFHTPDNTMIPTFAAVTPTVCTSATGDCAAAIAAMDTSEWQSRTDSTDLAAREFVTLAFDRPSAPLSPTASANGFAIIIGARHTLVSTYLFYQALAFAGERAGDLLAQLERRGTAAEPPLFDALRRIGAIDVSVSTDSVTWVAAGQLLEAGPLATDPQALPITLPAAAQRVYVRLSLTKGYWRVNHVALAARGAPIVAVAVLPDSVVADGITAMSGRVDARAALRDSSRVLITGPGDRYRLHFSLPTQTRTDTDGWELFLESTGWYYEWMRPAWKRDENALRAAQLLYAPFEAFRALAPDYKQREATNERAFLDSRITRPRP